MKTLFNDKEMAQIVGAIGFQTFDGIEGRKQYFTINGKILDGRSSRHLVDGKTITEKAGSEFIRFCGFSTAPVGAELSYHETMSSEPVLFAVKTANNTWEIKNSQPTELAA